MKKTLMILLFCSIKMIFAQENARDYLSTGDSFTLDNTEFFLNWSAKKSKILTVEQYLPRDEKIEDFTHLVMYNFFNHDIDMEFAARQKIESLQKSTKDDKYAIINMAESPDGKEYVIDYSVSSDPGAKVPFLEYNIYRFKKSDRMPNKPLLIFSYTKRYYGEDLKAAKKLISRERDAMLTEVISFQIPEIKPVY